MAVGPKLMLSAGLACAGLGLVGAGAGATFTAQVSGTMSVSTGTVALSLNGQTGPDVHLDLDGRNLGSHFAPITEDLRLKNTGTLDLARSYLALTSTQCAEPSNGDDQDDQGDPGSQGGQGDQGGQGGQGGQGDQGGQGNQGGQGGQGGQGNQGGQDGQDGQDDHDDAGALAHALHVTVTDVTHHVTEYDGPLCSGALEQRALRHAPAAGETIHYELVLSPDDLNRGLPAAAMHSRATLRVTFTGFDH